MKVQILAEGKTTNSGLEFTREALEGLAGQSVAILFTDRRISIEKGDDGKLRAYIDLPDTLTTALMLDNDMQIKEIAVTDDLDAFFMRGGEDEQADED